MPRAAATDHPACDATLLPLLLTDLPSAVSNYVQRSEILVSLPTRVTFIPTHLIHRALAENRFSAIQGRVAQTHISDEMLRKSRFGGRLSVV